MQATWLKTCKGFNIPRNRLIIFDAAGTLIHLKLNVGLIYSQLSQRIGITVPRKTIDSAFHEAFKTAPEMVFPNISFDEVRDAERNWWKERVKETFEGANASIPEELFEDFFNLLWNYFGKAKTWSVSDEIRPLLLRLKKEGYQLAILSNFDLRLLKILEGLNLADMFDEIVLPSFARAAKPSPEIFRYCLERLHVHPSQAIYVGDDPKKDVEGAKGAGIQAINIQELATLGELLEKAKETLVP